MEEVGFGSSKVIVYIWSAERYLDIHVADIDIFYSSWLLTGAVSKTYEYRIAGIFRFDIINIYVFYYCPVYRLYGNSRAESVTYAYVSYVDITECSPRMLYRTSRHWHCYVCDSRIS